MKKLLPHAILLLLCLLAFCACGKCEVCTFGDWTTVTLATCTQPGTETRVCAECEFVEEREIPQLAHDMVFAETKTAATCTEKGADLYKCKNCDHTEDRSVTALGHKYGEWSEKTAATCTATGTKERTCSVCGDTATQTISATGHKYGTAVTVKNATCSAEGLKKSTCSACGDTKEQIVGKTAHNYSSATCTKPRTCKSCGTTSGNANGHSWKDATCTEAKKCTACGVTEGTALGHTTKSGTCSRCDKKITILSQSTFTFVDSFPLKVYDNAFDGGCMEIQSVTMTKKEEDEIEWEILQKAIKLNKFNDTWGYLQLIDPRGVRLQTWNMHINNAEVGDILSTEFWIVESTLTVVGEYKLVFKGRD